METKVKSVRSINHNKLTSEGRDLYDFFLNLQDQELIDCMDRLCSSELG